MFSSPCIRSGHRADGKKRTLFRGYKTIVFRIEGAAELLQWQSQIDKEHPFVGKAGTDWPFLFPSCCKQFSPNVGFTGKPVVLNLFQRLSKERKMIFASNKL